MDLLAWFSACDQLAILFAKHRWLLHPIQRWMSVHQLDLLSQHMPIPTPLSITTHPLVTRDIWSAQDPSKPTMLQVLKTVQCDKLFVWMIVSIMQCLHSLLRTLQDDICLDRVMCTILHWVILSWHWFWSLQVRPYKVPLLVTLPRIRSWTAWQLELLNFAHRDIISLIAHVPKSRVRIVLRQHQEANPVATWQLRLRHAWTVVHHLVWIIPDWIAMRWHLPDWWMICWKLIKRSCHYYGERNQRDLWGIPTMSHAAAMMDPMLWM